MATVAAVILPDDIKKDGTWNVKIRVSHKSRSAYIETKHYIGKKQLDKNSKIKDHFILDLLAPDLKKYRATISTISDIEHLSVQDVKNKLIRSCIETEAIDLIHFGEYHIASMIQAGRESSTKSLITVLNSLKDYFKSENVPIKEITAAFLFKYETYLHSERTIKRINQLGKVVETKKAGLSDSGLHNHMRDLRLLFNAARNHYNDEDSGIVRILHYPFKKYKIGQPPETKKRGLTVEQIKAIRDFKAEPGSRAELARDLFMLSFYLCGMNAADLYKLEPGIVPRVEYNRSKTASRRKDKAFISIKLPAVANLIYEKYAGNLQLRYSLNSTLLNALDKGISTIIKGVGFDFDFYSARHSVGDLARNKLRYSKDDVGMVLNHKDRSNSITDIYISKDWSIIDEIQEKLINLLS